MKILPPFKWFMLQNFPFIEYDFDALTNYELMCKIAGYVQEVADETNANTQEIQKLIEWTKTLDLQDEVDNKLDEMALDGTLAQIINQEIFNELNTIVQQNNLLLNDTCKLYYPYRGSSNGDCSVIQVAGKTIVIDLGKSVSPLITWLSNKGITKIDYLIISHYHSDHIGGGDTSGDISGFETFMTSEVIDTSEAVVYLPHKGIDWSRITASDKAQLMSAESGIKALLTSLDIEYIEPDNNQLLVLSQICNIKFLNIGSEYYNGYYETYSEYNNFSMCCEITHNNRHVLYTGDIMPEAQANITGLIYEPDILKAPHHDLEPLYNSQFLHKCTSKIMIFQQNQTQHGSGYTTQIAQAIHNNGGKIYDNNNCHNVTILLKNDNIISNADNGNFSIQSDSVLNASGIHLANGTDLNNVIDIGNYYTNTNDETKTLLHLPLADEGAWKNKYYEYGKIKIINIAMNMDRSFKKQFLLSPTQMWYRYYNDNNWSKWINIGEDVILGMTDNMLADSTDLNDVFHEGKYLIKDNTSYNTMDNRPSDDEGGSTLIVMRTRYLDDLRHQFLITGAGNMYMRVLHMNEYGTAVSEADNWYSIDKTEITE